MTSRLIDIHPHIISTDTVKYPVAPVRGKRSSWSAIRPKTFEELVDEMAAASVDKACIVHSSTTYGFDPSYLADIIEANSERFAGVFSMDVLAPNAAETFRYWVGRGLSGIRLFTGGTTFAPQPDELADPRSYPVWDAAVELGIPITIQLRPLCLPQLLGMVKRFPDATILIDNTFRPNYEEGPPYYGSEHVFMLAGYQNVNMKIITNGVRGSRAGLGSPETFYPRLVDAFGPQRIAWGSNFPASEGTLAQLVGEAQDALACLSDEDRDWIFSRTAQRLFPVLADVSKKVSADKSPAGRDRM